MNLNRITFDQNIMGGKPCIRGMRITVGTIVGLIAAGRSYDEILKAYPYLGFPWKFNYLRFCISKTLKKLSVLLIFKVSYL